MRVNVGGFRGRERREGPKKFEYDWKAHPASGTWPAVIADVREADRGSAGSPEFVLDVDADVKARMGYTCDLGADDGEAALGEVLAAVYGQWDGGEVDLRDVVGERVRVLVKKGDKRSFVNAVYPAEDRSAQPPGQRSPRPTGTGRTYGGGQVADDDLPF